MPEPRNPPMAAAHQSFVGRLDSRDPAFRRCPHTTLDTLRTNGPVHQDREFDRVVLTRAADVASVLADRSLSVDPYKARPTAFGRRGITDAERGRQSMVFLDAPDHARLRGLVAQVSTARAVEALRPRVENIASVLLDAIEPQGPFDLVAAYAAPLPILVIAATLGIDGDQREQSK